MLFVTKQVLVFTVCIILQITMLCVIYKTTDFPVEEKRIPPTAKNPGRTYLRKRSPRDSNEISSLNKIAVTQQKETADKNVNYIQLENNKMTHYNSSLQTQVKTNEDELPPCVFHFEEDEKKSVSKIVRQAKSQSVYIIYLTLKVENDTELHKNKNEFNFDDLVDWQIVDKSEKFLEELPIDFDLITFNLFWVDKEVKKVHMNLRKNNSNCQMKPEESIKAVQFLLWKEILNNSTNYYLCNRLYKNSAFREFVYYLTTVWIGYDLKCSEWPQKTVYLNKTLPELIAIFCYLLSLQFVWIFSALDIKYRRDANDKLVPISVYITKKNRSYSKEFNYRKNDRPCGIRRVLLKLFYGKRETCSNCCSPSRRLFALVWIFIIMPFSLYKVIGRNLMYKSIYKKIWNAIRTSEPFFNCIDSEEGALACDILYATFIPCFYIIFVEFYHKSYRSKKFSLFTLTKICINDQQDQQQNIEESFTGMNDRFISRIDILKRTCNVCNETLTLCCCLKISLCFLFDFPFQIIFSIFPFFSFAFHCLIYYFRKKTNGRSQICKGVGIFLFFFVYLGTYILFFRPMLSTFTFIFRIIMYFVFVTLAIRIHLFRYTLIIVMAIVYFVRYLVELINMKSEILEYIFEYKRKSEFSLYRRRDRDNINENETINEEEFDGVIKRLLFEKRKKYFFCMKSIVVLICLAVIMMIFIFSGTSKTAGNFKEMLELVLFLISPFAISVFLKAHDKGILSKDDKKDIEIAYDEYKKENPK